jgi:hypothetical protein
MYDVYTLYHMNVYAACMRVCVNWCGRRVGQDEGRMRCCFSIFIIMRMCMCVRVCVMMGRT